MNRVTNIANSARPQVSGPFLPTLRHGTPPELIASIEDKIRNTLDRHRLPAFATPWEAAIAHEARPAIVGPAEGLTIERVTVFSRAMPPFGLAWGWFAWRPAGFGRLGGQPALPSNRPPFVQIMQMLHQNEKIQGRKLRKISPQVTRQDDA